MNAASPLRQERWDGETEPAAQSNFIAAPYPAKAAPDAPVHGTGTRWTDFARELVAGLQMTPKRIPSKYLYDNRGAALFERIAAQPEYYLTRIELALLREHGPRLAACMGEGVELVEFGASSPRKARVLLEALRQPRAYVPIDISAAALLETAAAIAGDFPDLEVRPLVADYTASFSLDTPVVGQARRAGFFPGSSIGNFSPYDALVFLRRLCSLLRGGGLLIGADLVKDPSLLHAAYNDTAGVTALFNRNVLQRANNELGADFVPERFSHYAFYDPVAQRMEMHLVSLAVQRVRVAGYDVFFADGETVHTEDSYKYTVPGFRTLAAQAGFVPRLCLIDSSGQFSLHWLESPS